MRSTEFEDEAVSEALTGPERVRAAALEVAARLFAERGIHSVSVREIARETGVSHTLLHLYFGSKDEILRQVLLGYHSDMSHVMTSAENLPEIVSEVFRDACKNKDLTRVLAAALVEGVVPEHLELTPDVHHAMHDRLNGELRGGTDPRVLVAAISAMVIGWAVAGDWMTRTHGMSDVDDDLIVDQLTTIIHRMVAASA